MKKTVIVILTFTLLGAVTMIITCNRMANTVAENSKEFPIIYTKTVDSAYLSLFGAKDSIHDAETMTVKGRKPISAFAYGNEYFIEISKLNCPANRPLDSIITISYKETRMSQNVVYTSPFSRLSVISSYAAQNQETSQHLYVTIFGDGISQISKNDSTIIYQGKLKNFGLKYSLNSLQNIYLRQEEKQIEPVRIIFARRNNSTYLVLIGKKSTGGADERTFDGRVFR
ncbi:hypothetical protein [Mucilaginibacter psychrotolerans]|nr:hypothetical protein [Mucilaginibacter psychrotolerans]